MKSGKWLSLLIPAVMLLFAPPLQAHAEDTTSTASIQISGTTIESGSNQINGGTADLDLTTGTLTLKNIKKAEALNINGAQDFQIIVNGNCSFGSASDPADSGIDMEDGDLDIQITKGSSLSMYTTDTENIYLGTGALTISGPGKLTGQTFASSSPSRTLSAYKDISLKNGLNLALISRSHGIYSTTGSVSVDNSNVSIQANRYGILAEGHDYSTKKDYEAGVTLKNSTLNIDVSAGNFSGIYTGSSGSTIENTSLRVRTSKDYDSDLGSNAYSLYTTGNILISGANTNLDLSDAAGMTTEGGTFTMENGSVKIQSVGSALSSSDDLAIKGGKVQAVSKTGKAISTTNGKISLSAEITAKNTSGGIPVQAVAPDASFGITVDRRYPLCDIELYTDMDGRTYFVNAGTTDYAPYTGTVQLYIPKVASLKLSSNTYIYNGTARKPAITAVDNKKRTIPETDYKVSYPSGRKKVGKYDIKITFKGYYNGTYTKTFKIIPKKTSLLSVKATKKGFTVKWKKQAVQTTGYQIQYARNKKFTKNVKYRTIAGKKNVKKTIQKLKSKKTYYMRVRTYKQVRYKGKKIKICSGWSKVKKIKTA